MITAMIAPVTRPIMISPVPISTTYRIPPTETDTKPGSPLPISDVSAQKSDCA